MRVALATAGRFHSFDLARQLHRRDAFAGIFSGFPMSKLQNESLPAELIHSYPFWQPLVHLGGRLNFPMPIRREIEWRAAQGLDAYAKKHLPECDAYVALSSSGLAAGKMVQERGGIYVCDRGSTHIRGQDEGLREEFRRYGQAYTGVDPRKIEKEEAEYAVADAIFVPTQFVARTFLDRGFPEAKLRRAMYGVDLSRFSPTGAPPEDTFEVLFVGALSIRKGIRYLLEAFERFPHPNKRLTLVGAPSPHTAADVAKAVAGGKVVTTGPISRDEVRDRMSRSHALVLPSVEEGLALVQGQAMACGCPVIATPNTGSEDLFTDGKEGFVVPVRDPAAIADRLTQLADEPERRAAMSHASMERVKSFGGWDSYGEAVYRHLQELTGKP